MALPGFLQKQQLGLEGSVSLKTSELYLEVSFVKKMSILDPVVSYHLIPWVLPAVLPFYSSVLTSWRQQKVGASNCPLPCSELWTQSGGLCMCTCINQMQPCGCQLDFQWVFYRAQRVEGPDTLPHTVSKARGLVYVKFCKTFLPGFLLPINLLLFSLGAGD